MEKLISVIVPVYKAEKYLSRCVGSILEQTFTDFELILVDDGSPDKSGELCDKYAKKDFRIKVIHKENGGVSSARNSGLDVAKGKYITFIDSDDWIAENYLEILLRETLNNNADFSICALETRGVSCCKVSLDNKIIDITNLSSEEFVSLFTNGLFYGPCTKFYVNEIIQKHVIRFRPLVRFGEDRMFVRDYLKHCKKICTRNEALYFYNKLNEASATKNFDPKIVKWSKMLIENYLGFLRWFKVDLACLGNAVSKYTFDLFCLCAKWCVEGLDKKEAINEIKASYLLFENFLNYDRDWKKIDERKDIREAASQYDFEKVYDIYFAFQGVHKRNKLRKLLSEIKGSILYAYLERKRDNLNKYKYLDK